MKLEKITHSSDSPKRRYDDACGTAHALDLIGERWALLVVRELMFGPKRFGDLRTDLPGISANVLTQRLEGLEASGVVRRRKLPPPASVQVYELTEWGYEAEEIIQVMGRWAIRSPSHDPTLPISSAALMSSFRTMFAPSKAADLEASIGVVFGDETFLVRIAQGRLSVTRGPVDGAGTVFSGTPPALGAAVYDGQPLEDLAHAGTLSVSGDRALAERFLTLFVLPPKA
ncbi:MAG: winged helix-turn-helix transcriptional regulator [Rhizobiaceae bacterium]